MLAKIILYKKNLFYYNEVGGWAKGGGYETEIGSRYQKRKGDFGCGSTFIYDYKIQNCG